MTEYRVGDKVVYFKHLKASRYRKIYATVHAAPGMNGPSTRVGIEFINERGTTQKVSVSPDSLQLRCGDEDELRDEKAFA
jgi:hypothetical protein